MPRIKQLADQYAKEDLLREIRGQACHQDLKYDKDLAEAAGIPITTFSGKIKNLDKLSIVQLRKIIIAFQPDPIIVLRFLGYDNKQIKSFAENTKEVTTSV